MRVIFFGTAAFAVPALERLAASAHAVALCVTQPDRPQGRGLRLEPSPVKVAAQRLGVPLIQPERLSREALAVTRADVGVLAAYGQMVRRDVLGMTPHGILGLHPSLLPKYRGAAPVAWAILNGESETGMTVYRLDERLDAGSVLRRLSVPIPSDATTDSLTASLALVGAGEIVKTLDDLDAGRADAVAQDESSASLAPKLSKEQGWIDWAQPAELIARRIRAFNPWPGAMTTLDGSLLKLYEAESLPARSSAIPGTVISSSAAGIDVAAAEGVVRIRVLQAAGRRRMTAAAFLAGRALQERTRLGPPPD